MRLLAAAAFFLALAASAAAAAQPDPEGLVLRQSDMPRGYSLDRDESGLRTNALEAKEYPQLRSKFGAWRRIVGYQVEYERDDETIGSRADLFRGRSGPQSMLVWFRKELRKSTLPARATKLELGDEAWLYRWKLAGDQFGLIVWRFRTVFALVGASELRTARTIALARTQQRRIAAAVG
jgi:hypothetical protein